MNLLLHSFRRHRCRLALLLAGLGSAFVAPAKPNIVFIHFDRKATRGWNGHTNAIYAAMLKRLDASVGRILDTLAASAAR